MKATTVKIEGILLREIESAKPKNESLSSFVRSILQKDIDRRRLRAAAIEYRTSIDSDDDERAWLDEWDNADLSSPVQSSDDAT